MKKLKYAIISSGRPQYAIAAAVGVTETELSRIVGGRKFVSRDLQERIAAALEMDVAELFTKNGGLQ